MPTGPAYGEADARAERARIVHVRQELLAPVTAIAGYAEMLRDEAQRAGLHQLVPDLERILEAGEILLVLVGNLFEAGASPDPNGRPFEERLRHDLRNSLSAIKGYGELLLEDLEQLGSVALTADLNRLLAETVRLLSSLDTIVAFSPQEATEAPSDGTSAMITDFLRSLRPAAMPDRRHLTGRILVIDDNASNRDLLARHLERAGHEVAEAASGHGALRLLEAEEVDLVLLDLVMPDMNGLEVLSRLKTDPHSRDIPVIMISGLHETESVIRCIEIGAEDYLTKPFDRVLLQARLDACLERKLARDRERLYLVRLEEEKRRSDTLLRNILPNPIVERLHKGEVIIADRLEHVTILFCDLVGFTKLASTMAPAALVDLLNGLFSSFDALARRLGVEKIKTIGDAYMAAAGLPEPRPDHAEAMAEMALNMLEALERLNASSGISLAARIGMHSGPVVAGIIGTHKFSYDVWGDTVNVASRLEAAAEPGRIHVSNNTLHLLQESFSFERCRYTAIRGRGRMRTAFLLGRKAAG